MKIFHRLILSGAARLIDVEGNQASDEFTPVNAVVDDDRVWKLPPGLIGKPDGQLCYTFSSNVNIGGFMARNAGDEEDEFGTIDFTIYTDGNVKVEGELPAGSNQLIRFPLESNIRAKNICFVVKSFVGANGGGALKYFWFY